MQRKIMQTCKRSQKYFLRLMLLLSINILIVIGCTQQQSTAIPGESTMETINETNTISICNGCVSRWESLSISVGNLDMRWIPDDHGEEHLYYTAVLMVTKNRDENSLQVIGIHEDQEVIYEGYRIRFLRVEADPGINTIQYIVLSIEEIGE